MRIVRSAALFIVIAVSTVLSQSAQNDWEVYGARQFNRRAGTPAVAGNSDHYTESFTVPVQSDLPCTLQIINGDEQGIGNRTAGATVVINGQTICTQSDFQNNVNTIQRDVVVKGANTCDVTVYGNSGGHIIIHCLYHFKSVHPIVECVRKNPDGSHTAQFGYQNDNSVDVNTPIGLLNLFLPLPIDRGQPTVFKPGRHTNVFSVVYKVNAIIWELGGLQAIANNDPSLACGTTDTTKPTLSVTSPADGLLTRDSVVTVTGTVSDQSTVTVTINGAPVTVTNGSFQGAVSVQEGTNVITIKATDSYNNTTTIVRNIVRDSTPPSLTISAPSIGIITNQSSITVSGTATDTHAVTISVNGTAVSLAQNGSWTGTAALKQGTNTITVVAADAVGNTVTISRTVTADWTAPVLVISSPLDSTITKLSSMTVSGTIKDSTAVTLTINGNSVPISNGTFTTTVNLAEGTNKITIVATDAAGNTTSISRTVRVDRIAPALVVSSPLDSVITNLSRVTISGTVKDSTAVTLTVNGVNVPINNGSFTTQIVLTEGKNRFTIVATDAAGNTTTVSRTVIADRTPPSLAVSSPIDSTITNLSSIIVSGTISDSTAVTLTVNGQSVSVSNGSFAITIFLTEGINKITIAATDAAGNTSSIIRTVRFAVQPPVLTVQTPVDSQITNLLVINVNGTVTGSSSVSLTVNGNTVPIVNNSFTSKISLTEGINTITFIATDAAGNKTIVSRFVIRDTQAPIVNLKSPIDSLITKLQSIVVSGTVKDSTKIELFVNGNPINVNTNGSFNDTTWLIEGMNLVQVSATDAAGNTTFIVRHVRLDTQPPVITIFSPSDSLITKNTKIVLNGSVTDSTAVIFTINGVAYPIHSDGSFSDTLSVSEGANTFTLVATDFMGNQTTIKRTVSRNTKSPVINLIAPLAGITTIDSVISLTGSINDVSGTTITLNGLQQSPDQNGGFKATMKLIQGSNPISITATDQAGNTSVFNSSVTRVLPVPDPAVVAPKLDTTVATNMGDATAFLYSGPNPIQKGVTPGTIKKMQVCVVRGHVLDKNRNPLKGVNVSVLNHSEFGSTLSRDDGMYDLAVNGGSYLTINYDRIGYLPAQRKVDARWQLYRRADDVVLLQMDTTAHHIDLSAAQIVQGNQVTDSLGSRKPSLFIRPGTTANLIFNKYTCRVLGSCSIGANYWCGTPTTSSIRSHSLVGRQLIAGQCSYRSHDGIHCKFKWRYCYSVRASRYCGFDICI
jgi:hypothetical protein